MEGTMEDPYFHIFKRVIGQWSVLHGFPESFFDRRDKFTWNGTSNYLVYELKSENEMEISLDLKEGDKTWTEVFKMRRK